MRYVVIVAIVAMVLAAVIGIVEDWGRPYSGPSLSVYLLLIGFALLLGNRLLVRQRNCKSNNHEQGCPSRKSIRRTQMDKSTIESGLMGVGQNLDKPTTIVLAGSAASVLRREIEREAHDCDIAHIDPDSAEEVVVAVGNKTAASCGLDVNWLNAECFAWRDEFPKGWDKRTTQHGVFGNLCVQLMSKADCASMKVLRVQHNNSLKDVQKDVDDFFQMDLSPDERGLVLQHVECLEKQGFDLSIAKGILKLF